MKRFLIAGIAIAAVLAYPAAFAQVKISELPAASALGGTEATPTVQGGVTSRMTPAQINTYIRGLASSWTFVSTTTVPTIQAFSTAPQIELRDSDSAANNQRWNFSTGATTFTLRACNDAGSSCTTPLTVSRTNENANAITLGDTTGNPQIVVPGSGQWTIGGTPGTTGQVLTSNGTGVAPTWQTVGSGGTTGTFTPSCTFGGGMSACTGTLGSYVRVGNTVMVNFGFNGTGASATQSASVVTPVNTANTGNVVVGVCTSTGTSGSIGRVTSGGANTLNVTLNASQTTSIPWSCAAQYIVN